MSREVPEVFESIVRARRATRAFLPKPAPEALVRKVFSLAQRSPSNCNTQPWRVVVVSGDRCEALRTEIVDAVLAGRGSPDFPYEGKYEGVYRERQFAAAFDLYDAMGIARDDRQARSAAFARNFRFFEAPHVAFIFLPEPFGIREAADVGMYAQTLMLALTAHGMASCPQTALSFHADVVRKALDIEDSAKLLFGISFGYADPDHPTALCRVDRAPLEETTRFVG